MTGNKNNVEDWQLELISTVSSVKTLVTTLIGQVKEIKQNDKILADKLDNEVRALEAEMERKVQSCHVEILDYLDRKHMEAHKVRDHVTEALEAKVKDMKKFFWLRVMALSGVALFVLFFIAIEHSDFILALLGHTHD